ncbi:MAG: dihydroorotase [Planctomycetota bacterium]
MRHRIRGAKVVFADEVTPVDVVIEGGTLVDIDSARSLRCDEETDATGLHLLPGVIDDQVHFREPGFTHKEDLATGSAACARGGITSYLEMPNTRPTTTTVERLHDKLHTASTKSAVNYGFYMGATADNVSELQAATRTPGIKIFVGSSTGDLLVDEQAALERIFRETQLTITAHCEDEATIRANRQRLGPPTSVADHSKIRDVPAAVTSTRRVIDLAKRHRHRFHVLHVSTAAEIDLLRDHDQLITAEVCPHHLFFNVDDYDRLGTLIQANPSIKSKADNEGLFQALLDGTIQVIATDHAPHTREEKQAAYPDSPSGIPSVENVLVLMLDQVNQGRCSLTQIANWMSAAPAKVWDIVNKGRIQAGYDADLVLVDLNRPHTIRNEEQVSKCGWSPWDGLTLSASVVTTFVNGQRVFHEGQLQADVRGREITFDHGRGGYWSA